MDSRYDLVLSDPVGHEQQGIITGSAGLRFDSAQQMTSRITEAIDFTSFDQWSVIEQSDWHHGRGREKWDNAAVERFYDSYNVDTRIEGQITLGPRISSAGLQVVDYPYPGVGDETTGTGISASGTFTKRGQSFQATGTPTISIVTLRLEWDPDRPVPTAGTAVTLRIETDSSSHPSGTLAAAGATGTVVASAISNTTATEVVFTLTTPFAASAATVYWLVLSHDYGTDDEFLWWRGTYTSGTAYPDGRGGYFSDSWHVTTDDDYFFTVNDVSSLVGTVTCFCQFNDKVYVGAGKAVYVWDNTLKHWTASKANFASNVTDMVDFASVLWVAQSDGNLWTFDGTSTWAEKSGKTATYLLVYKGYLYRSTYSTDNQVWYTADGAYWAASGAEYAWKLGNPGRQERTTALAGYDFEVQGITTHGLYQIGPESEQGDLQDQIKDWRTQYDPDNGRGTVTWAKDAKLYIPLLGSLLSYGSGLFDSVGPDQDAGLPADRQGNIVDLLSLTNWLIAAVDAGATKTSSVLVYNGVGWNELVRIPQVGQSCRALGYDTTVSPHRLWFGYGSRTGWVELPDLTDNPYLATNSHYTNTGYLIEPWISYGLLGVDKDYQEVGLQATIPTGGSITVEYEVDRSGFWTTLFTIGPGDVGNVYVGAFPFTAAFATDPIVGTGSTTKTIECDSTDLLAVGDWVRINDQIRQIASITDANTFGLVRQLATAPLSGDVIRASRPCGAEIRRRLTLSTTDPAATPLVQAVWLKAMPMLMDKLAGHFTCDIYDGQVDRGNAVITPDAATRVAQLYSFANRPSPVDLIDKRGYTRRVKITAISETQGGAAAGALGHEPQIRSTFSLNLIEV